MVYYSALPTLIPCHRKYSQSEGIHCIFDSIMPTPLIVYCDAMHAMPLVVYFKCCLSNVRTKFFPQHLCSGNDRL